MRKLFCLAVVIALLLSIACPVFASVGYQKDGDNKGNASKIDFRGGYTDFDGSTVTFYTNGYGDNGTTSVTTNVSSESNLTSAALAYGVILKEDLDSTSSVYVTLANGTPGQMLTIIMLAHTGTGDWVITDDYVDPTTGAALVNKGWDDLTFDTALDSITLLYLDDSIGWIIVGNNGVTVT